MHTTPSAPPYIYLAPIRGLTDALFREVLFKHFAGFDAAVAPFINPQGASKYEDKMLYDVLHKNNQGVELIPQLLNTKPIHFLGLAQRLAGIGYTHINWNLGCPAPMIAKKKRGSGLLPYPDEIIELLEYVIPRLDIELSIKTRLGYYEQAEIEALLPRLNDFPLKEIIIHARLGKQLYTGVTSPDGFQKCLTISDHTFTYNGDINDLSIYTALKQTFPEINRWMIGRGALGNPLIAEEIKGICTDSDEQKKVRLQGFHDELLSRYKTRLSGPSHILGRLKQLWAHMITSFPGKEKLLKKILKTRTLESYQLVVDQIFSA
ncbi:MAG: tRNA-dihydrouridine synthase [Desulfotalea sp.]|nr:MAG: tRNA-dihydrouridine synthase [Desulfotalea sp.]